MAFIRFRKKKDIPSGLWKKCEKCEATLFAKELARNLHICGECGFHFRVGGRERIRITVDHDSFVEFSPNLYTIDRLNFVDTDTYQSKLVKYVKKTGNAEAGIYGTCTISGHPAVLAVIDFDFLGGSMGSVVGEKITRAIELSTEKRIPVIVISASGGARMHEGALSLMQMAKSAAAIRRHHEQGGLYISVLTNPTTGGVMASFAALGDITLAEPNALIGFAGPRVIKQTLRTELPDGFQRSEFLMDHGYIDRIVPRVDLRSELTRFLSYLWKYQPGERLPEGTWQPPQLPPEKLEEEASPKPPKSDSK